MQSPKAIPAITIQAFCLTKTVYEVVEQISSDRRCANARFKIHMGGIEAAINFYRDSATPDLILIESREEPDEFFGSLDLLSEYCSPESKVVIIGTIEDKDFQDSLLEIGISAYLTPPLETMKLISDISNIYNPAGDSGGKILGFVGASGGVGASTIAQNVGWSAATLYSLDTLIADLDVNFGSVGLNFNTIQNHGIKDILASNQIDKKVVNHYASTYNDKLKLLLSSMVLEESVEIAPQKCSALIEAFRMSAAFCVLDIPLGWSDWQREVFRLLDDIVIVVTPDLLSLRNAKILIDKLSRMRANDEAPYLVINQVGVPKKSEISKKEIEETLALEAIMELPFEPQIFTEAANSGQMIAEIDGKSTVALSVQQLTELLGNSQNLAGKKPVGQGFSLQKFIYWLKTG